MENRMEIPLAMQGLDLHEIELVCEVFRSGNLTMGKRVEEFESAFAKYLGTKNAIMVNSGSSANMLAVEVLKNRSINDAHSRAHKDIVVVPAVLWPTSLWPLVQLGYEVLLIDTLPGSLQMDLSQIRKAKDFYGARLVGAVIIHPLGFSLELVEIQKIKDDLNMWVIEDTCESLGAGVNGSFAGSIGEAGTFSFYYSHHITTVEGGMVVTDDDSIADELRSARAHGWTRNRKDRNEIESLNPTLNRDFLFVSSGFNFRPMEFQGALGVSQLAKLPSFIERRILNIEKIQNGISGTGFEIIDYKRAKDAQAVDSKSGSVRHSWMALPISWKGGEAEVSSILQELKTAGIHSRPLLAGNFAEQPAGHHESIKLFGELDNSKKTYSKSFMLGNHHNMTELQIDHLIENLVSVANRYE
jgi:CDP-6-deoxy-D-xylo-4-hexulose-3-dehydrase